MARTNLPLTALVGNSGVAEPAGTAIDQANGMVINLASTAVPAAGGPRHLIIQVKNTFAGTKVATIRAGANPPSMRAALGDITFTCPASANTFLGPFEAARVLQADGTINIDFASGITGTINALLVPRTF
jgi:hypothetical protein